MDTSYMLAVVVTGLVVILAALVLLIVSVYSYNVFKKANKQQSASGAIKTAKASPFIEEGISDEVIAVITAAIAAMNSVSGDGKSYAIRSIKNTRLQRPVWALAGLSDNTRPF